MAGVRPRRGRDVRGADGRPRRLRAVANPSVHRAVGRRVAAAAPRRRNRRPRRRSCAPPPSRRQGLDPPRAAAHPGPAGWSRRGPGLVCCSTPRRGVTYSRGRGDAAPTRGPRGLTVARGRTVRVLLRCPLPASPPAMRRGAPPGGVAGWATHGRGRPRVATATRCDVERASYGERRRPPSRPAGCRPSTSVAVPGSGQSTRGQSSTLTPAPARSCSPILCVSCDLFAAEGSSWWTSYDPNRRWARCWPPSTGPALSFSQLLQRAAGAVAARRPERRIQVGVIPPAPSRRCPRSGTGCSRRSTTT